MIILINYVKLQLLDPARVHGHSSSGNAYADFLSRASYSPRGSASTRGAPISMTISQAIEGSCGYIGDSPSTQVVILEVYLGLAWATGACVFGCIVVQVGGGPSQRMKYIMDNGYRISQADVDGALCIPIVQFNCEQSSSSNLFLQHSGDCRVGRQYLCQVGSLLKRHRIVKYRM